MSNDRSKTDPPEPPPFSPRWMHTTGQRRRHVAIVTPVLDDWESFAALVSDISRRFGADDIAFHVVAVDDGSATDFAVNDLALPEPGCIATIEVLHLAVNLGHQRAVAAGLSAIAARTDLDAAIVMDSDGEDHPGDIAALLAAGAQNPDRIILAHRAERSEGLTFRLFYWLYKAFFRAATGRTISFGNFSLIPMSAVARLVYMPELWNNLAASIMRSRLPYATVPTARGQRFAGRSKMSLLALVTHGLSAMSVYTDRIFVRVMVGSGFVALLSLAGMLVTTVIKFATDLAIPGWATTIVSSLMIILSQTIVVAVATTLMILSGRSNRQIIPVADAPRFIARSDHLLVGKRAADAEAGRSSA